jgi:hypothetical protein
VIFSDSPRTEILKKVLNFSERGIGGHAVQLRRPDGRGGGGFIVYAKPANFGCGLSHVYQCGECVRWSSSVVFSQAVGMVSCPLVGTGQAVC